MCIVQKTPHKVVDCGTLYVWGRCSQFGQLAHACQKDGPEIFKDSKALSPFTRPQMMRSHAFAHALIFTPNMPIHLALSLLTPKNKGSNI